MTTMGANCGGRERGADLGEKAGVVAPAGQ